MEWWIFQPQADISVLELANLISKLKRIPDKKGLYFLSNLLGVNDALYDAMPPECKRHFVVYQKDYVYRDYTPANGQG